MHLSPQHLEAGQGGELPAAWNICVQVCRNNHNFGAEQIFDGLGPCVSVLVTTGIQAPFDLVTVLGTGTRGRFWLIILEIEAPGVPFLSSPGP